MARIVDRWPYPLFCLMLIALAHNAMRWIAIGVFHRPWGLLNYLNPPNPVLLGLTGVLAAICLMLAWKARRRLERSGSPIVGSGVAAVLVIIPAGLLMVLFGTLALATYGLALFVLVPFCLGALAAVIHGWNRRVDLGESIGVAMVSVALLGVALLAFAIEGVICLVMATPLAMLLAVLGGGLGYVLLRARGSRPAPVLMLVLIAVPPTAMDLERGIHRPAPRFAVTTSLDIEASPQRVWLATIAPSHLPHPEDWVFRLGIAYPLAAHIEGEGVGAVRYCNFSTGNLVEPVLAWQQPSLLRFSVLSNPQPMQEWTPYTRIHPPHLDGFLVSRQGQFRLIPLPNGGTRLEATTWYEHNLWPAQYWRLWSDFIIHRVHRIVLEHVREVAAQRAD